jgi:hypothetical protein
VLISRAFARDKERLVISSFTAICVRHVRRAQLRLRCRFTPARMLIAVLFATLVCFTRTSFAQIELPQANPLAPIVVEGKTAHRWKEGVYDVWLVEDGCRISQGNSHASGAGAMIWIERDTKPGEKNKALVFLEGNVAIEYTQPQQSAPDVLVEKTAPARIEDKAWFGRMYSHSPVEVRIANPGEEPKVKPAIYQHAMAARAPQAGALQRTQFETLVPPEPLAPQGMRRVQILPRSGVAPNIQSMPSGNETVTLFDGGVNIIIDGLPNIAPAAVNFSGSVDVSADRVVVWSASAISPSGSTVQPNSTPLELYMEGNIVFREGDRVVQAKAMYFNVTQRNGVILDAEVLAPVPREQGLIRVKADVMRQLDEHHFVAENASFTTSRMGIPTYEFRSGTLMLEDNQVPAINPFTGQPEVDAEGAPIVEHDQLLSGSNNVLSVEGVPVFYWPFFAADLKRPPLYIESVAYRHDNVFGSQALVNLNPYQLLGVRNPPKGTDWTVSLDYLSDRGFGGGTKFDYDRTGFFDWPGRYHGFVDAWYIDDHGIDNLGLDRRTLTFPNAFRGRTLFRHEQELPWDLQFRAEVGQITDRNFLEQYYQHEWEEQKDQVTRLGLRKVWDDMSLELSASAQIDDFFMQTQNLPQLDHYWLGQSLLNDTLTYYEHTSLAYLQQNKLTQPTDPTDLNQFHFLPYDVDARGERLATRQEIDYPVQLGPVKVVPYALGEVADWGEDINGQRIQRAYGQVGVRSSLPFWSVDPSVRSSLFNVNGVAHKVTLDADFSYTDANKDLNQLVIYDEIDDDNVQALRRRLGFEVYNDPVAGPTVFSVPQQFDERFYAVRRGAQDWVTGPTEISDDLMVVRLGAEQRWQTKRGIPGQQHIIDWITLDTNMEIFPKPEQNFDQAAGMFDYDFHWFIGDRLTFLSYGGFDFFDEGQQWTTTGIFLSRPPRGSIFLGFNSFEGPISSEVISASYTYRMTQKWLSTFGTSFDIKSQGNIGENFRLTRVGESFLFTVGFNVDVSRGNVGFNIAILPRFLGRAQSVTRGQVDVPPAGIYGLE